MIKKILLFLLVLIMIGASIFFYTKNYLAEAIQTPKLLFIPTGSTKSTIMLFKNEGIDLHWFDYYLIQMKGYPQAGWIELDQTSMSRDTFFEKITKSKAALQKVTLIPGETNVLFLQSLSKQLDLNLTKLQNNYTKFAPYKDGVIFAETYNVPIGINEKGLMQYLVLESLKNHRLLSQKHLKSYHDSTWFTDIITKASIIQKEAANIDEMPIISAVIKNRIRKKMKLQMDGTLNYGKFSHVAVTAKKIREDTSHFNTYKHAGLPPYPVCAVSVQAVWAALNPASVDYLYFVRGKNGKHIFSKTYKEHQKNIK